MNRTEQIRSHAGPSLLALAIVHTLLVAASIVAGALLKHGATVVNPYRPAEEARRFFADNPLSIRVSTFFLFGSSVPLGIYAATRGQPLALPRCLRCRQLHCPIRGFCSLDRAGGFRPLRLGPIGAGSVGIAGRDPSAPFHDFAVRRSVLRGGFWASGRGSIGYELLLPSASALASLVRHSHRGRRRTCFIQPPDLVGRGPNSDRSLCGFVWLIAVGIALPKNC